MVFTSLDVVAGCEQVRGEAVTQGVMTDRLCESSRGGGALYGALNDVKPEMMPAADIRGAGVHTQPRGRKHPLPLPRSRGAWVFDSKRVRQPYTAESLRNVRVMQLAHAGEVSRNARTLARGKTSWRGHDRLCHCAR